MTDILGSSMAHCNHGNTLTQTNTSTGTVTNYTWDYENHLAEVKVVSKSGTVLNYEKFTYDVFGNRIGVSLNGTQTLYTVYDGSNPYMDFNGSGSVTERYLTNPDALSRFYGQVSAGGTVQWLLTDNINSIRQVVDSSGNSLDVIAYDPWGTILSQSNAANAPRFLYTGGAYDPITVMYTDGAREMNPVDGRWMSRDPLGFNAGDTNLYRYAYNSPTSLRDPLGKATYSHIHGLTPEEYELVNEFLKGRGSINDIPERVRRIAANWYEQRSATVRDVNNAMAYNVARATALRTGVNPPGSIHQFNAKLSRAAALSRLRIPAGAAALAVFIGWTAYKDQEFQDRGRIAHGLPEGTQLVMEENQRNGVRRTWRLPSGERRSTFSKR